MSIRKKKKIPIYRQLVQYVHSGFISLETGVQQEIKDFIVSCQYRSGAFIDRAGQPDLYYSLFGLWLSLATEQKVQINALKDYTNVQNKNQTTTLIDELVLILLKAELESGNRKYSTFAIIGKVIRKGKTLEWSYKLFLIALVFNAIGKDNRLLYFFVRVFLSIYKSKKNFPCSLISALLYARKLVKLKTDKLQYELSTYALETGGFRANKSVHSADGLSTAVALFALRETEYDLRLISQNCLYFIQENYSEGAFLSGYRNDIKDLEYTFYGLLALGSLVSKEEK